MTLTLEEGCRCTEPLYRRYGPEFARERGIACPPVAELRRGVAAVVGDRP